MLKPYIKSLTSSERTKSADIQLGLILAFIAGAINAGGFLAVGQYTSHMTGILSSVADFIVLNKLSAAILSVVFLFCFIFGAASSAIMINWARTRKLQSEYAIPLMFEAVLLVAFGFFALHVFDSINITIALLCYIMGLQNAIITKISRSEIRTTHITGMSTDIGIEIGRFFYSICNKTSQVITNFAKLKLHTSLLLAFLVGGVIGAYLFKYFGFIAILPFSIILMILAIVPIIDDIKHASHD